MSEDSKEHSLIPDDPQGQHQPIPQNQQQLEFLKGILLQITSEYSGPLPRPDFLREYDKIVPGAAERIIHSFEQQGEHRQWLERTNLQADTKRSNWGLVAGFVVSLLFLVGSVWCILSGHDWAGGVIATTNIASLVYVFVNESGRRRIEREQRAGLMRNVIKNSISQPKTPTISTNEDKKDAKD